MIILVVVTIGSIRAKYGDINDGDFGAAGKGYH